MGHFFKHCMILKDFCRVKKCIDGRIIFCEKIPSPSLTSQIDPWEWMLYLRTVYLLMERTRATNSLRQAQTHTYIQREKERDVFGFIKYSTHGKEDGLAIATQISWPFSHQSHYRISFQ